MTPFDLSRLVGQLAGYVLIAILIIWVVIKFINKK